jgi:hypothetical protein
MPILNTTIEIEGSSPEDDSILHLEVHFTTTRASRGARGPHGEQLEPDEESSIEIRPGHPDPRRRVVISPHG